MLPGRCLAVVLLAGLAQGGVLAHADTIKVTIDKLVFAPAEVNAKVGDTIEWVNGDILAHTATVRGDWDVLIPPKKTVTHVMDKAGAFDYICRFHPNMKARIVTKP